MIISHSRRFIFVHIHKCAGTSVKKALQPFLASTDVVLNGQIFSGDVVPPDLEPLQRQLHKHSTAEEILLVVGKDIWNSYFKFAFVRHPLDRLVSFYEFLNRIRVQNAPASGVGNWPFRRKRKTTLSDYPDQAPWNWPGMKALLSTDDFSQFIRSEFLVDEQGVNPQTRALADRSGNLLVDFVGKVESIERDWRHICDRLEIQPELEFENESPRRSRELRDYWKEADLDYVLKTHAAEFELFSYAPSCDGADG